MCETTDLAHYVLQILHEVWHCLSSITNAMLKTCRNTLTRVEDFFSATSQLIILVVLYLVVLCVSCIVVLIIYRVFRCIYLFCKQWARPPYQGFEREPLLRTHHMNNHHHSLHISQAHRSVINRSGGYTSYTGPITESPRRPFVPDLSYSNYRPPLSSSRSDSRHASQRQYARYSARDAEAGYHQRLPPGPRERVLTWLNDSYEPQFVIHTAATPPGRLRSYGTISGVTPPPPPYSRAPAPLSPPSYSSQTCHFDFSPPPYGDVD